MRRRRLLALLFLGACATSSGTQAPAGPPRVMTGGGTYDVRVTSGDEAAVQTVQASPEAAWAALPKVFQALEIPVTHVESDRRVMGNPDYTARRSLGGARLERFINCGASISGPITADHSVRISLLVQVLPSEGGEARLSTRMVAQARSRQGVSSSVIPCGSTGRLEARVVELLNSALDA